MKAVANSGSAPSTWSVSTPAASRRREQWRALGGVGERRERPGRLGRRRRRPAQQLERAVVGPSEQVAAGPGEGAHDHGHRDVQPEVDLPTLVDDGQGRRQLLFELGVGQAGRSTSRRAEARAANAGRHSACHRLMCCPCRSDRAAATAVATRSATSAGGRTLK